MYVNVAVNARFFVTTNVSGFVLVVVSPLQATNALPPVGVPVTVTLVP